MNGDISYDRNSVGGRYPSNTTATFACNDGYSLYGHDSTTCQTSESGIWTEETPTCEGNDTKE